MIINQKLKFIDLFAGIGGFHLALSEQGHECVLASELQEHLRGYYKKNFYEMDPNFIIGDIHNYPVEKIPAHDILCAGFPCQPFSQAGKRQGLDDPKNGNHFEKITDILRYHKPTYLILENVASLEGHDKGNTWKKIKKELSKDYQIEKSILSPHQFGIPQNRKRIYIVGKRIDKGGLNGFNFIFNESFKNTSHINSIIDSNPDQKIILKDTTKKRLSVWQEFLDHLKPNEIPRFPIWTVEFGADYPYESKPTYKYSINELKTFKGSFGQLIDGNTKNKVLKCLPPYVREGRGISKNKKYFPAWKIQYIKRNRDFYKKHKEWLDPWLIKIKSWDHSHQKFEWNCGEVELTLKDKIIQFRPSGIRVKNPEKSPALVLTSTQIPIFFDSVLGDFRYMTSLEGARLQSMENLKHIPESSSIAFKAFGNAVNVKVVSEITKKLFYES